VGGDVASVVSLEGQAAAVAAEVHGVARREFGVMSSIGTAHCNCEYAIAC
jgi:hypothetical protein